MWRLVKADDRAAVREPLGQQRFGRSCELRDGRAINALVGDAYSGVNYIVRR